tara:strand:- start:16 stop:297 length:282 start_codon:yes stop_codon:yes gene_type:complete
LSIPKLIKKLKLKNKSINLSNITEVFEIFNKEIQNALEDNRKIELRGFGTFYVKELKEKFSARNPKTGELIYVPKKNKIRFNGSKKLKEFINK